MDAMLVLFVLFLRGAEEREIVLPFSFSQLLFVLRRAANSNSKPFFSFRFDFVFMLSARATSLPPLKMRRAASRLAALVARQQRFSRNALSSSSSSSTSAAGAATGSCSSFFNASRRNDARLD